MVGTSFSCCNKCKNIFGVIKVKRSNSAEIGRKISKALTGKKASVETRSKMSETAKKRSHLACSEETKTKIGMTLRRHIVSQETRDKISKTLQGRTLSEEHKEKMKSKTGENANNWRGGKIEVKCDLCGTSKYFSKSRIKKNKNNFCSNRCRGIWAFKHSKKKGTSIETAIENELIGRKIPYLKQSPVEGVALVDFLLSDRVVLQADGDYWHNLPGRKNRDSNQDFILEFNGYKVFRFTETEIKKSAEKCIDKVIKQNRLAQVTVNVRTFIN